MPAVIHVGLESGFRTRRSLHIGRNFEPAWEIVAVEPRILGRNHLSSTNFGVPGSAGRELQAGGRSSSGSCSGCGERWRSLGEGWRCCYSWCVRCRCLLRALFLVMVKLQGILVFEWTVCNWDETKNFRAPGKSGPQFAKLWVPCICKETVKSSYIGY